MSGRGEWSGGAYIIMRATDHDVAGFKAGDKDGDPIQQGKWYATEGPNYRFLTGPMNTKTEAVEALISHIRTAATPETTREVE